jgi:hypothetical protein
MKAAKPALVFAVLCLAFPVPANNQSVVEGHIKFAPGAPQFDNGLGMSIRRSDDGQPIRLVVTFRSLADTISFMPGTLVHCGGASATSQITLDLTDSDGHRFQHLPYLGEGPPYAVMCEQTVEFIAVLPQYAALSVPLDLGKYFDFTDSKEYVGVRFRPGTYSLVAEFTNGRGKTTLGPLSAQAAAVRQWSGAVRSNVIEVHFDHEFTAPFANYPN